MSKETSFSIKVVHFKQYEKEIKHIRQCVFIDECKIPEKLEWDAQDEAAKFAIAQYESKCIAVGRLLTDGHIGRVAVLKEYRHQGIGTRIIKALIQTAVKQRLETVFLTSQQSAVPFYQNMGFVPSGDLFQLAGIPHQLMSLRLT